MSLIRTPSANTAVAPAAPCPHHTHTRWELSCAAVPLRLYESRMYNDLILPSFPLLGHCILLPHHSPEFHKAYSPQLPWRLLPLSESWLKCPWKVTAGRDKPTDRQASPSLYLKKKSHTRTGTVPVKHVQMPACRRHKAMWWGSAIGFPAHHSGGLVRELLVKQPPLASYTSRGKHWGCCSQMSSSLQRNCLLVPSW